MNYKVFIGKVEKDLPLHFGSLDEWERIKLYSFEFYFTAPEREKLVKINKGNIGVAAHIFYDKHAEHPYQILMEYITKGNSYGEEIQEGWVDTLTSAYNQIYEKLKELTEKEEIEVGA